MTAPRGVAAPVIPSSDRGADGDGDVFTDGLPIGEFVVVVLVVA